MELLQAILKGFTIIITHQLVLRTKICFVMSYSWKYYSYVPEWFHLRSSRRANRSVGWECNTFILTELNQLFLLEPRMTLTLKSKQSTPSYLLTHLEEQHSICQHMLCNPSIHPSNYFTGITKNSKFCIIYITYPKNNRPTGNSGLL